MAGAFLLHFYGSRGGSFFRWRKAGVGGFSAAAVKVASDFDSAMSQVAAASGGETEAGTTQRDVVRLGVVSIAVSFSVSPKWLKVLTGFKQREKIAVAYFDTEMLEMKEAEMFVEGYKAVLVKDTSFKGLWKVSFTLREF